MASNTVKPSEPVEKPPLGSLHQAQLAANGKQRSNENRQGSSLWL